MHLRTLNLTTAAAVPELRAPGAVRNFNQALAQCDYDLEEWRATKVGREARTSRLQKPLYDMHSNPR